MIKQSICPHLASLTVGKNKCPCAVVASLKAVSTSQNGDVHQHEYQLKRWRAAAELVSFGPRAHRTTQMIFRLRSLAALGLEVL